MKGKNKLYLVLVVSLLAVFVVSSMVFADVINTTSQPKTYSGTVYFRYGSGFILKTDSGEEIKLVAGPPWYLDELGLSLKSGDRITVKGVTDDDNDIIFASSIKKGVKTYQIADPENTVDYSGFKHMRRGVGMHRGERPGTPDARGRGKGMYRR